MKFLSYIIVCILLFTTHLSFARLVDENGLYELEPLLTDTTLNINAEFGALFTTGTTESTSILSKLVLEYEMDSWRHKYTFESLFIQYDQTDSETNKRTSVTSDETYTLNAEGYYKITDTKSALVFWGNEFDRFGQYTSISSLVVGYNFRAIDGSLIQLDLNVAPGYTFIESDDGTTDSAPVVRGSAAYSWRVSRTAQFTQNITFETSSINTRVVMESALTTKIHGSMRMKVSYQATSDDDIDDDDAETSNFNTQTSVTLMVNF